MSSAHLTVQLHAAVAQVQCSVLRFGVLHWFRSRLCVAPAALPFMQIQEDSGLWSGAMRVVPYAPYACVAAVQMLWQMHGMTL